MSQEKADFDSKYKEYEKGEIDLISRLRTVTTRINTRCLNRQARIINES
jgi:hypothetical protein